MLGKNSLHRCLQTFARISKVQLVRRSGSALLHPCPNHGLPVGLKRGFPRGVAPRVYTTTPASRIVGVGQISDGTPSESSLHVKPLVSQFFPTFCLSFSNTVLFHVAQVAVRPTLRIELHRCVLDLRNIVPRFCATVPRSSKWCCGCVCMCVFGLHW